MNKKRMPVLMMVVVLLWAPAGLFARGTDEADLLRFGSLPAISAVPIIYAQENGFFAAEGINVDIIPFNSPHRKERRTPSRSDRCLRRRRHDGGGIPPRRLSGGDHFGYRRGF
jgi:hypothetical protein